MKTKLFPQQMLFIQKKQGSETLESNKKRTYFDLEKNSFMRKKLEKNRHMRCFELTCGRFTLNKRSTLHGLKLSKLKTS